MSVTILHGDVRTVLPTLPANSVHTIITSPPYWGLRSYLKKGDPLKAFEIGSEKTPEEHIAVLVEVFRECRRVLRDDGTLWVVYGDAYASGKGTCFNPGGGATSLGQNRKAAEAHPLDRGNISELREWGMKPGDLIGLPWMLAFAMRAGGWWLRQDNIWHKTAPMPESVNGWRWERHRVKLNGHQRDVGYSNSTDGRPQSDSRHAGPYSDANYTDCPGCPKCEKNGGLVLRKGMWRTTRAHEYVFQFSKNDEYFCDAEAAKEPCSMNSSDWNEDGTKKRGSHKRGAFGGKGTAMAGHEPFRAISATRNPRTVWTLGPEPFRDAHFATFPKSLVRKIIEAATSEHGCCAECGSPMVRVVEKGLTAHDGKTESAYGPGSTANRLAKLRQAARERGEEYTNDSRTIGWRPSCECATEKPSVSCVVLDPFGGSGTVGEVAEELGRNSVLVELNPAYLPMATKRTAQQGLFCR